MDGIIAIKDGVVVARDEGRGIGPALRLYAGGLLDGAEVADRIVGRAAAAVFVLGGVVRVRADVMSRGAAAFLAAHDIPASAGETVDVIVNRMGTGACPMETAVAGLDDPQEMVAAVMRKLEELKGGMRA